MNFEYIEDLVTKCKNNDKTSKEKLAEEFRPFIINISKRTFIDRYDMQDIQNQCYETLFKCIQLYDLNKHRFVGYAVSSIKNNLNDLIKKTKIRNSTDGNDALSLHADVESELICQDISLEDLFSEECDYEELRFALNKLNEEEKALIDFIFFKNNTIRTYSYIKNMCYSTACLRRDVILKKLFKAINQAQ
ncbi:sigma-70 family RNA polymerase sigma factor [Clostridium sp. C2-6-12]|uniref:sigma-70 family RNA polymerase sigma factor n=1 Tax=Clostridium sp. C2-6-12 TaxID=2698832 RepID=UPI00136F992E|nr:sigma-70 family RNA polymerase sigma factor [Clostridium sp. C2-6-12]